MADRMPWDITAGGADGQKTAPAGRPRAGRHLIVVMLLTAAALDLTRCGLVLAAARHQAPTAGLAAAGLAAAALTARTARGCQAGRRWAGLAALLIGAASAPQAAMSGFHGPYTIPDTATAAVGILLAVAVLATAGPAGQPGQDEPRMLLTGDQQQRRSQIKARAHLRRASGQTTVRSRCGFRWRRRYGRTLWRGALAAQAARRRLGRSSTVPRRRPRRRGSRVL